MPEPDQASWAKLSITMYRTNGGIVDAESRLATIVSLTLETCSLPVYNIEVHGQHVYQVGDAGILVHNHCHHIVSRYDHLGRGFVQPWTVQAKQILQNAGIGIESKLNKVNLPWHNGSHPEFYHQRVFERLENAIAGLTPHTAAYTQKVTAELQDIAKFLLNNPGGLNGTGL